jgi:hypothetical protein
LIKSSHKILLREILQYKPLGILIYGSTVSETDYLPSHSDMDLIVVSKAPIVTLYDNPNFTYIFNTPRKVISEALNCNPFIIGALKNGIIYHDPKNILNALNILTDNLSFPNADNAFYYYNQAIAGNYSRFLNYCCRVINFNDKVIRNKVLYGAYRVLRAVAYFHVYRNSYELISGFDQIVNHPSIVKTELCFLLKKQHKILSKQKHLNFEIDEVLETSISIINKYTNLNILKPVDLPFKFIDLQHAKIDYSSNIQEYLYQNKDSKNCYSKPLVANE